MVWAWMIYTDMIKMKVTRKIKGLENCRNLRDIKIVAQKNPNSEYEKIHLDLRRYRNRKLAIWFISLIISIIALIVGGIISAR